MTLATDFSCPNCGHAIKLTESLAAPLVAATRADYERRLAAQTEAVAAEKLVLSAQQQANERRTAELAAAAESQQEQIARAVQQQVREQVQQQLSRDRKTIADEESARARQQVDDAELTGAVSDGRASLFNQHGAGDFDSHTRQNSAGGVFDHAADRRLCVR